MILFYDKRDGKIFATIDGRVHDKKSMKCSIDNGIGKKNIGKIIIGWEEADEIEEYTEDVEKLVEIKKDLFKKVKKKETKQRRKMIEHNPDKFKLLQEFESISPTSPLDYKIKNNKLVKNNGK